jgi:hypothetical protein
MILNEFYELDRTFWLLGNQFFGLDLLSLIRSGCNTVRDFSHTSAAWRLEQFKCSRANNAV